MYNGSDIANRIKNMAKEQNKSLGELLSACGLGVNTISKMSKGTDIHTLNFARIADYLGCSVDYLLGRTDNPKAHLAPKDIEYESAVSEIYESPKKLMKARLAAYKAMRDEERRQAIQAYRESLFSEELYKLAATNGVDVLDSFDGAEIVEGGGEHKRRKAAKQEG